MIEAAQEFIPAWMLLSAAFGFIVGYAFGDQNRYRKCLEQENEDFRDQLQNTQPSTPIQQRALDQQRRVINDIHKRVVAAQKGLEKPTS